MKALVLAAGLGTRLRPLTNERAKPSLPVLGVPSLWYSAWHLRRTLDVREFSVNLSHRPESVRAAAEDAELAAATGVRFHFSDETSQVLGSSGALKRLGEAWIGRETLAVCNGDSICFADWKAMLDFHRRSKALVTLHVRRFEGAVEPYTVIELDGDGRVVAFGLKASEGTMFSGCYLFEPSLLARLSDGVSEIRPSLFEPLAREKKLFAYAQDVPWFDTGTVASYANAQFEILGALPEARALIEVKMREDSPGCWVPRSWPRGSSSPRLRPPVVMTGSRDAWMARASAYGPRFVGIEPPPRALDESLTRDAVALASCVERF